MFYEVVIDKEETPNKCTIAPLAYRTDFHLIRVKGTKLLGPLQSSILLHHQGQCLSELKQNLDNLIGIATIDCVWRRLDPIIRKIDGKLPVLARIPDGFQTAYPRRSADNSDPSGGLATIEAIFAASAILGHWDLTLLSEYYFGGQFIEMNRALFVELGVHQAADPSNIPTLSVRPRHARQRKINRGQL